MNSVHSTAQDFMTPREKERMMRFDNAKRLRTLIASSRKPMAEKPMAEKSMAEKPMAEKPMAEKPMAEKPMAEKPMAEKSGWQVTVDVHGKREDINYDSEINYGSSFQSGYGQRGFRHNMVQ